MGNQGVGGPVWRGRGQKTPAQSIQERVHHIKTDTQETVISTMYETHGLQPVVVPTITQPHAPVDHMGGSSSVQGLCRSCVVEEESIGPHLVNELVTEHNRFVVGGDHKN